MENLYKSKYILVIGLVLVIIGLVYLFSLENSFDIRKFTGDVVSIENDTIMLNGIFGNTSGALPEELLSERDFSFRVDDKTQFEKLVIDWPTWDKVKASGGSMNFDIKDLPQSREAGSLDDLKSTSLSNPGTVYMEVDFSSSIYNSPDPVASSIFYKTMTISPSSTPTQ